MSNAKRFFFYLVSLVTLGTLAGGVGILLSLLFSFVTREAGRRLFADELLSLGLAMVIIGGILWFLLWRFIRRQVSQAPAEVGSAIRKLYLNFILLLSASYILAGAFAFITWLLAGPRVDELPSGGLAMLIVSGALWYYHYWLQEAEGQPSPAARTLRRWYVYILSSSGLIMLAVGLGLLLSAIIFWLPVWGEDISRGAFWNDTVRSSISLILIGGVVWVFHWFRMSRGDADSTLRQVYLYILAISGGAIAALSALIITLYKIFNFAFDSSGLSAGDYFEFLAWTIPAMLIAGAIWFYHRRVVQEETSQLEEQKLSTPRVYLYLMSFVSLGAMVTGLMFLLGILIDMWINAADSRAVVASGWWHEQLSLSLAMMLVGLPLWMYYWRRVLRLIDEGGVVERGTRSRRVFLYAVLGIAVIVLVGDLVTIVFQLIYSLFEGGFGADALREARWSLQSILIPLPVLIYHWRVLREDQRLGAEKVPSRKNVTALAGEVASDLIARIEEKLGSRTRRLYRLGEVPEAIPSLSDEEIDRLVEEIVSAPGDRVMLVVTGGAVIVVPYMER